MPRTLACAQTENAVVVEHVHSSVLVDSVVFSSFAISVLHNGTIAVFLCGTFVHTCATDLFAERFEWTAGLGAMEATGSTKRVESMAVTARAV